MRPERYWIAGDTLTFKATAADTGGAYALIDMLATPGEGPPPHIHDNEDETFYVLDGRFEILSGERVIDAGRGTFAMVPRGTVHRFRCVAERPSRMLVMFTPGGLEGFFREAEFAPRSPAQRLQPPVTACALWTGSRDRRDRRPFMEALRFFQTVASAWPAPTPAAEAKMGEISAKTRKSAMRSPRIRRVLVTGMASVTVASLRRYVTVASTLVTAPSSHEPDHTPTISCFRPLIVEKNPATLSSICRRPTTAGAFPKRKLPFSMNLSANALASNASTASKRSAT
jgi:quercetin dioxygenase-like cupin family protein